MECPSPSQVVAIRIAELRTASGLTRKQLAERVSRYLTEDEAWTETVVVNVEGRAGRKLRAVTPNELVALNRVFGVSVISLMLPSDLDQPIKIGQLPLPFLPEEFGWLTFHIPAHHIRAGQLDVFADEVGYFAYKRQIERIHETIEDTGASLEEAMLKAKEDADPDIREFFSNPSVNAASVKKWLKRWKIEQLDPFDEKRAALEAELSEIERQMEIIRRDFGGVDS